MAMIRSLFLVLLFASCRKMPGNGQGNPFAGRSFVHPGMLHTAADFDRMMQKVNTGSQPQFSGWQKLLANPHSSPDYRLRGPVDTIYRGSGSPENYFLLYNDIAAAYQNALRWKVSGSTANADKAVAIMNAWASKLVAIRGSSDRFLAAGIYGYEFANAAEIMRAYPGWAAGDFSRFKKMMLEVFYPTNHDFLTRHNGACISHYWANWDGCNLASVMAIGILCDDPDKFDEAISYFKSGAGNGSYQNVAPFVYADSGGLAQCQESGRDQGHSNFDVALYGVICQMAFNQGEDLFAYNPMHEARPRIQGMCEYVAAYNLGGTVPYTAYNNCDNVNQTMISANGRGDNRPAWELLYAQYVQLRGQSSPNIEKYALQNRPEGGGGDYGPNSGGFDQLGFGTLTFAR